MRPITLELDNFINPAVGAEVSFHSISWNAGRKQSSIPSGGNLHYHSLPSGGTVEHSHEFGELILILSGSIVHRVNGDRQLLEANSIAFVRPDDRHGFLPAPDAPNCELLLLSFHLEFFVTISRYLEDDGFLHRYTEGVLPAVFRLPESRMNELSLQLLNLNSRNSTPAVRKIRFKVILVELFTRFFLAPDNAEHASRAPEWLDTLCELMRKPENFIPGLHRMQQLSGYTPEHLCKVFRKYLDKSPTEYVNELRINHAARLLADTDEPIASISYRLNFQSLSRFYHLFRKQYACTPAEYRRRALSAKRLL